MSSGGSIRPKLDETAKKVDEALDDLIKPRKPISLYEAAGHIIRAGGKRLRPFLTVKSCEIVGGDPDVVIPFAAAMEALHSFTLIHDDIMDNDDVRRGAPTVHVKWGIPIAIASGDLFFAKVYEAMVRKQSLGHVSCEGVLACIERVTDATIAICEGQVLDVSFPNIRDVSEEDYLHMVGGKTAALFKTCAEVGAIVGGGCPEEVRLLGGYAWDAGVAFQIIDDYLGLTADEETLGKPVGSDLREGKKTMIIIHALKHASPREREVIERVLGNEKAPQRDIGAVNNLLESLGSLRYTLDYARRYAEEAKAKLNCFPDSEAKRDLLDLVDYFMSRTH